MTYSPSLVRLRRGKSRGFSLIEMLLVLSIMISLSAGAMFGLGSLLRSTNFNHSVGLLGLAIEQSQNYARAHNTHVWVALRKVPQGLELASFYSLTGSKEDFSDQSTPRPLHPLSKATIYQGIDILGTFPGFTPGTNSRMLEEQQAGLKWTRAGQVVEYKWILRFSPDSSVVVEPEGTALSSSIYLAMAPAGVDSSMVSARGVLLVIPGLGGNTHINRAQIVARPASAR